MWNGFHVLVYVQERYLLHQIKFDRNKLPLCKTRVTASCFKRKKIATAPILHILKSIEIYDTTFSLQIPSVSSLPVTKRHFPLKAAHMPRIPNITAPPSIWSVRGRNGKRGKRIRWRMIEQRCHVTTWPKCERCTVIYLPTGLKGFHQDKCDVFTASCHLNEHRGVWNAKAFLCSCKICRSLKFIDLKIGTYF